MRPRKETRKLDAPSEAPVCLDYQRVVPGNDACFVCQQVTEGGIETFVVKGDGNVSFHSACGIENIVSARLGRRSYVGVASNWKMCSAGHHVSGGDVEI